MVPRLIFMDIGFPRAGSWFGPPSWGPSWSQIAIKIHFEVGRIFDFISQGILMHLGLDLGGVLGAKMESKSELKMNDTNICFFLFSCRQELHF